MEIKGRTLAEVGQDILGGANNTAQARKKRGISELDFLGQDLSSQDAAAVDVSKSAALLSSFDAQAMIDERKERVERLKKLVQSGEYQMPSSEELASSLGEELIFEILSAGLERA